MKYANKHSSLSALAFAAFAFCGGAVAQAQMAPSDIYNEAEDLFLWLENDQGFVSLDPVTRQYDQYYYRCYTGDVCLGAGLDGYAYLYNGKELMRLDSLENLKSLAPKLVVQEIGVPEGVLADDLALHVASPGQGTDLPHTPLIIGEGEWSSADKDMIANVFGAGTPIALFNATLEEINALRTLLGLSSEVELPSGVGTLEVYALDTDVEGDFYELQILPVEPLPAAAVESYSGSESTGTVIQTSEEAAPFDDTDALQAERVRILVEWLRQDRLRDMVVPLRQAQGKAAFAAEPFKNLEDVVRSTESRMVFRFRKNIHTLLTNVWSVHNATTNEDWFYVKQQGNFSAANELLPLALVNNISSTEGNDRGRFTDFYGIDTLVNGYANNSAVFLDQSSPITTTNTTKVSSSVSWSLSGKLSASGKCDSSGKCEVGAGGEISGGVSVNKSYSYDIPDITVRNQSGTRQNNAAWDFAIAPPTWTDGAGCIGFSGLGPIANVSGSTFQPVMQWIWRVGPEVRAASPGGLPLQVNFRTRVRHIYYGPFCNWNMTNWSQASGTLVGTMSVPWPAK